MKFRSWNEEGLRFVYFEDGKYFLIVHGVETNTEFPYHFNWQNAEQEVNINPEMFYSKVTEESKKSLEKVAFFEGDIVKMHFFYDDHDPISLGWVEGEKEVTGILKCENLGGAVIVSKDKEYSYSLLQDPLEELEILGNIHENKEQK